METGRPARLQSVRTRTVQEFAMALAHEVAISEQRIPERVVAVLRQKLGSHRMDLWFGADAKWSVIGHNTLGIEVSSPFVADCLSRMFRSELQQSIEEVAGSGFGYVISVSTSVDSREGNHETTGKAAKTVVDGIRSLPNDTLPSRRLPTDAGHAVGVRSTASAAMHSNYDSTDPVPVPKLPHTNNALQRLPASRANSLEATRADRNAQLRLHKDAVHEASKPGFGVPSSSGTAGSFPNTRFDTEQANVDRLVELRRENERRWDDFIPGEHNRLAYTAATMVLERPGQISPLFLHGPHGSGKTHLAVGLAHKLKLSHRLRRVLVLTGEQFTIEFTESARGGGFANFRRKYRDVEVLVIDDLQFCLGKAGTLAELRNTIDMLLREKRQVILVADRSLNELNGLTSDLHARLSGGMACGLEPLDVETRTRLLGQLCNKHRVTVDAQVIQQLASNAAGDARVLQGIVHRIVAQERIHGGPLNAEQAIRCTLDLVRASQPVVRMADIERVVCETFGLADKMLREKSKCQNVSQPRMLAMFLARKYTRTALSEIGEYFGNRQHSTVISAHKKVESWLDDDELIQCGRGKLTVREILKNLESSLRVS